MSVCGALRCSPSRALEATSQRRTSTSSSMRPSSSQSAAQVACCSSAVCCPPPSCGPGSSHEMRAPRSRRSSLTGKVHLKLSSQDTVPQLHHRQRRASAPSCDLFRVDDPNTQTSKPNFPSTSESALPNQVLRPETLNGCHQSNESAERDVNGGGSLLSRDSLPGVTEGFLHHVPEGVDGSGENDVNALRKALPLGPSGLEQAKARLEKAGFPAPPGLCPASQEKPVTLVLMRHGESMWNDLKLFTGDVDIPLTERGISEALHGGRAIKDIDFDLIFTSRLVRSKTTALIAMTQSASKKVPVLVRGGFKGKGQTGDDNRLRLREAARNALLRAACPTIPVFADPALNERCYGDLQGLDKREAQVVFGKEQVDEWRRSHETVPPNGESLMDTSERSLAFFNDTILELLKEGRSILVVAHGNVLRCIIAHLSGLTTDEMLRLEVVTALPYMYKYDGEDFAPCCVLSPPLGPGAEADHEAPQGIASLLKTGANSLI